jgi:zinc protease
LLLLDEDEFAREVRVVQEERRLRTEDSPQGLTYEQFNATAFVTSPYRYPIIGWMSDLEALRVEDLQAWYRQWYVPNNATLVVVGAVEPEQVLALARTYFGPLVPRELPILKPTPEIPQLGERRIVVKVPAELPQVLLGYKTPVLKTSAETWEPFALQVLAGILGQGESARLSRNLVRGSEVATSAWVRYGLTSRLNDLFMLGGNPAPERDVADLEKALRAEVARLQQEPVSRQELSRVVAQVIAEDVYQRDSMFYQAMRLGVLETTGLGWRAWEEYVSRVKAVTAEQVRDVARRYLHDDRLTVATLVPLPLEQGRSRRLPETSGDIVH